MLLRVYQQEDILLLFILYLSDMIGCFETPVATMPVLSGFSSMELTLCRQLCLAQNATVAMMTSDSCYCGGLALLAELASSESPSCWNTCDLHSSQWCGNASGAVAYLLGNNSFL